MNWGRYRKTLAAAGLGLVELAAYIAADPRDLPSWVVTGALAINAVAVWGVRNAPPPRVAPTMFAGRPGQPLSSRVRPPADEPPRE